MNKLIPLLVLCFATLPAQAVTTSYWTQATEADFKAGTLENVVATNLGELKLSRAVKTILEQDPRISTVNKLIEAPDGTIYAGTGPHAALIQIKDQKVSTVLEIPDATDILSLGFDKAGRLLLGTGGEKGRVFGIAKPGDKPKEIFSNEAVQYVWAIQTTPDGNAYAATGPSGKLFEIHPDGSSKVLLETDENNLLSMVSDGKDSLFIGTDPHGLVYRVDRKTGESFVLYNAAESEVSALALDKQGNLYAATGEARDEPPQPPQPAAEQDKNGRPEGGETGVPIPGGKPGEEPKPPAPPDPNPGRPDPIPKAPQVRARLDGVKFTAANRHQRSIAMPADSFTAPVMLAEFKQAATPAQGNTPKRPHPSPIPPPNPGKPQPPQTEPSPASQGAAQFPGRQPTVDVANTGEARAEGNAVYKIDPNGFVTEIFREPVLVLAMVENNGSLLIATGSEGQIYQVNPDAGETVVLAKVDPKQVLSLLAASDGTIYLGMANVGSIATLSSGFAGKGTFTSPVLDATQISRFGKMQMHGSLPADTSLSISSRSGNVKEASEKNWSKWTDPVPAAEFVPMTSPSSRFLQYRVTFTCQNGKTTPVLQDVNVAYQIPNLPPQIKAVHVSSTPDADSGAQAAPTSAAAGGGEIRRVAPSHKASVTWEASDPNNDVLEYTLYFRRGSGEPWILLKDKVLDPTYEWDTRAVADGRYEIKVVASDANANPVGLGKSASRVSNPVVVDNTPPIIGDIKWQQRGGAVHVDLRTRDRTSTIAAVDFSVDSRTDWQLVLPVNQIYDSPEETVAFEIKSLTPGQHQVTLRSTDSQGNQAFENLVVRVEGPAASR